MSRELPAKPNLEHLKKQAKELLNDLQPRKPEGIERLRTMHRTPYPRLQN
jgi:hypothetical protein